MSSTRSTTLVPGPRARLAAWIESGPIQNLIIGLILLNALTLGLETFPAVVDSGAGPVLAAFDRLVLAVFVVEILGKLLAHGWRFFRSGWNVFDFVIVTVALLPASGPLAVLRTLRILRVLRLLSVMPRLRFIIEALLHAIPGIGAIAGLLALLFYISAVMATGLFGERFPEWFGTLGNSLYTLFQVMTLESWSMGIVRPVMDVFPYAWMFFVPFIVLATFTVLNLFIAIIVDTMQTLHERAEGGSEDSPEPSRALEGEIRALRQEIGELRRMLASRTGS